jgi:uncharacterized membrane protein
MSIEQIFIALLGVFCTGLGWFARELWAAVQELKRDLAALRVRVGEEYVRYDRLQDALKPIHEVLARIENTLTHKADK